MNKVDVGINSENLALWYRDVPITVDEFNRIKDGITKECRRYLIGKICEREKNNRASEEVMKDVYMRLGQIFGYVGATLKYLIAYMRTIELFQKIAPDIASDILRGKTRLSFRNTIKLEKMELSDVRIIMDRLANEETPADVIINEQKELSKSKKRRGRRKQKFPKLPTVSIKDTPPYDPDAQITALSFTIPSWVKMIDKAFMNTDLHKISHPACSKLIKELMELKDVADVMIAMLSDKNN